MEEKAKVASTKIDRSVVNGGIPIWQPRYVGADIDRPPKYRWEVTSTKGMCEVSGYIRVAANTFRIQGDEIAHGMTRTQAIAIAAALNGLEIAKRNRD